MPARQASQSHRKQTPGAVLTAAIEALCGGRAVVTLVRERPWASITFSGTRHSINIIWQDGIDPAAMEDLIRILPVHEFAIPGHFVADLLITEQSGTRLLVEALTIIDPVEDHRG